MSHVAKEAAVSRVTVSNVLNGKWQEKGVSEETRQRVLAAVRKTGYRPNLLARNLQRGCTMTLGVQLPDFRYDHWLGILTELDRAARTEGYHLLLNAPATWNDEAEEIRRLYDHRVDGLILSPRLIDAHQELYTWLSAAHTPFVFVGAAPECPYYGVEVDNLQLSKLVTCHLIEQKCVRIAHITGGESRQARERTQGYQQALREAGLAQDSSLIVEGHYTVEAGTTAMTELLSRSPRPDAVYCANDLIAIGAIRAIESFGFRVPQDLAVAGHGDDIPFTWFTRTPLTTVREPRERLAQEAVNLVLRLIRGENPKQRVVQLPGELVVRQSTRTIHCV